MRRSRHFITILLIIIALILAQFYRLHYRLSSTLISTTFDDSHNRPSDEKYIADANIFTNNKNANSSQIADQSRSQSPFNQYDGVVIVTKVLFSKDLQRLKTWLCLLSHAYNDKMNYDIVVFTTMPWEESEIAELQRVASPSKLTVALEGPPLEDRLTNLTKDERNFLYKRCNKKAEGQNLTWFHYCTEPNTKTVTNLGYSWQAEFRAYHIWTHPAIREYKYMMWLDADAKVSKDWDVDPMKTMIENDLVLLYSGFPYGTHRSNSNVAGTLKASYNTSICGIKGGDGRLVAMPCRKPAHFSVVAGMHHITNMDVYRKDVHQQFLKNYTSPYPFCRQRDDQAAVTLVAVMEQYIQNNFTSEIKKELVWHERMHNLTLKIAHHGMFDNERSDPTGRNPKKNFGILMKEWPGLRERCGTLLLHNKN